MSSNMKTTVEIADALFEQAKGVSSQRGTTMRELIEEGLRRVLADSGESHAFELRKASFAGNGLRAEVEEGAWEVIRTRIYEGRGG